MKARFTSLLQRSGPFAIRWFIRVVPPRGRGHRLVEMWHGRVAPPAGPLLSREPSGLRLRCDLADPLAGLVFYHGVSEPANARFFRRWLRRGDAYLDVGAYIGHTLGTALEVVGSEGTVVGVEASPATFRKLAAAVEDAQRDNVELHAVGLADRQGFARIAEDPRAATEPSRVSLEVNADGDIPVRTLDAIARGRSFRLVKIDVEGFEARVLTGGERSLTEGRVDAVLIELPSALEAAGSSADEVARLVAGHGYTCHRIRHDGTLEPSPFATTTEFEDFVWLAPGIDAP